MSTTSQSPERNLHFTFQKEGILSPAYLFKLQITNLPKSLAQGINRDLLLPIYSVLRDNFEFLESEYSSDSIVNYKGNASNAKKEHIVQLFGLYKSAESEMVNQDIRLLQSLSTSFSRYEGGDVYYEYKWQDHQKDNPTKPEISIDEYLVGLGVYLDSIKVSIDEYSKLGLVYRVLGIPSQSSQFDLNISKSLLINFRIEKKVSDNILNTFRQLLLVLSETFDLDQEVRQKFLDIEDKVVSWVG